MKTLKSERPAVVLDRLVRLLLMWICRKLVKQGSLHRPRIITYYRIMREAAESEFTEDNKPTLDAFLRECHSEANAHVEPPSQRNENR
jgi:hypothetical protein